MPCAYIVYGWMGTFFAFQLLPTELRIAIWEFCAPPRRVLQKDNRSGRWHVLPSDTATPPLLHACHESRGVWIKRYHAVHGRISDFPFVSYDHDIFLVPSLPLQRDYFDEFDVSRIANIGWTYNFLRSGSALTACQQILPSLQCFSIVVTGTCCRPNQLIWLPMKRKRAASAVHVAYLIYQPQLARLAI